MNTVRVIENIELQKLINFYSLHGCLAQRNLDPLDDGTCLNVVIGTGRVERVPATYGAALKLLNLI